METRKVKPTRIYEKVVEELEGPSLVPSGNVRPGGSGSPPNGR